MAFRFLDLPVDIREMVYDEVLVFHRRATLKEGAVRLSTSSTLSGVNRQLRTEFLNALNIRAPLVVAHVHDYNFAHVRAYIVNMPETQLQTYSMVSARQRRRRFIIELHLSSPLRRSYLLDTWIRYLASSAGSRANALDFRYRINRDDSHATAYELTLLNNSLHAFSRHGLKGVWAEWERVAAQKREKEKLVRAVLDGLGLGGD